MRLIIDTTDVTFFCTRSPEARTDRDTGAPRLDRETGAALWQVQVAALDSSGGEVLAVTVAGEPTARVGEAVTVAGLVAIPWTQGDRSGVAYRAASIAPAADARASGGSRHTGTSGPSGDKPAA